MIRPGPPNIGPGACPGGVVIHIYAAREPPVLLTVSDIGPDDHPEQAAAAAADVTALLADGSAVCLVAYDGDTGERFTADEWMAR